MKRLSLVLSTIILAAAATTGMAQDPTKDSSKKPAESLATLSPGIVTPEMWFYEQYQRQYQNPAAVVRQNAEFRAAQRMRRLAALRWFGMSNSRPQAGVDLINGDYSPCWVSNSFFYPWRWEGRGLPY